MVRPRFVGVLGAAAACGLGGCAQVLHWQTPSPPTRDVAAARASHVQAAPAAPMALGIDPKPAAPNEALPVEAYVARALAENRTVQAAWHNVRSLKHRIPQVMALDDPVVSNTVFPIPSVAPQYSLMGYNPYNVTLAQQFPWFGTLKLRGAAAGRDVQVALAELAAAQLDAVAAVKRAYCSLYAATRAGEILDENRKILEDFREVAKERLESGGSQQDVIRAGALLSELDRGRAENRLAVAAARSALARQIHARPDAPLQTLATLPAARVKAEFDQLQALAQSVRPELKGRIAAVARDQAAVALAEKRGYPNVTLGLTYMQMEKTNAMMPMTAGGMPNVGLFVAFNLPVYRDKVRAGVCEARERLLADARLFEAQRDETAAEIQDALVQVQTQQAVLDLLRDDSLPRARETFDLAREDYARSNVDYATVQSALREVLQVRLQVVQSEAELGKALAALERAVGAEVASLPADTTVPEVPKEKDKDKDKPAPPPADEPGPFEPPKEKAKTEDDPAESHRGGTQLRR